MDSLLILKGKDVGIEGEDTSVILYSNIIFSDLMPQEFSSKGNLRLA